MAALKPEIIKDAYQLIALYQRNPAFRERFDLAIKRNVNVTYKHRPLKLYFEVLASSNNEKFGESYEQITRLVRHDEEGLIKKTMMRVTTRDFLELNLHAKKAEQDINSISYPEEEIKKINKIEKASKSPSEKVKAHTERLDTTEYLDASKNKPQPEPENPEKIIPGSSPEHKKSYNPATQEEKARLNTALNQTRQEAPRNILVGPSGEPIRNIRYEEPLQEIFEPSPSESAGSSLPSMPNLGNISRTTNFAKNIFRSGEAIETIGVEAGARAAAGKAAVAGAEKVLAKAGGGAVARVGAGLLARAGFTVAAGAAATGVGVPVAVIITIVTAFGGQLKKLGKLLLQVTIAIICSFLLMFFWNWGERMNSLLPPYDIAESAPLPTTSPTPTASPTGTITPTPTTTPTPGGVAALCPVSGGAISCGSSGTSYYACPGGHCSQRYRNENPGLCETYPATAYGMDILAGANQPVYIPTIKDPRDGIIKNLECSFVYQEIGQQGQSINQYNCIIAGEASGDHYYIQFHHLRPQVPPGPYRTGSIAGYVWSAGDHTHVQIGRNGACQGRSVSSCVKPEEYLQCR